MKEYYKVYIANETQASSYPEPVKADFCGTIATKITPVLLPHSKVIQIGVFFLGTENTSHFMAAIPDLVIYTEEGDVILVIVHPCLPHSSCVYQVDNCDVCRAVCEMHMLGAKKAMHLGVNKETATVHFIDSNTELAEELILLCKDLFEHDERDITLLKSSELIWKDNISEKLKTCT